MLYADVVAASSAVAATPKRSEKVAILADLVRRAAPSEVRPLIGFLVGEPRQGRFGIGWASIRGAQAEPASTATLSIAEVDRALDDLARAGGSGSQRERSERLSALFGELTDAEQNHIVRLLGGELRQGANDGVVTGAVARAAGVPLAAVRRATMLLGDLAGAAERALTGASLEVGLTPLVAVQPMLAATSASASAAIAEVGRASVEWKLDGMRVQAHRNGSDVRLFTRGLNDMTAALPATVEAIRRLPVDSIVLDGEALGLDEDGRPRRFQDTMSGLGSSTSSFFFDVLHVDGRSLIDEPLAARKQVLSEVLPGGLLLPSIETDDGDEADRFAEEADRAGHEGVMVKALLSPYQAGRRGATWRKVKPVHTLDLVVLAAEWGHGRRTGWLSNLHLGARGDDGFVMVGKTFKGLTDDLLRWQTRELEARAIATEGITVFVRPELVVEIAIDGVQVSTRYPGGVALRFARVKRYRPDKSAEQADTIGRVQQFLR